MLNYTVFHFEEIIETVLLEIVTYFRSGKKLLKCLLKENNLKQCPRVQITKTTVFFIS